MNNEMQNRPLALPPLVQWTFPGRTLIFILAAASIWCLLLEMYALCDMRTFAIYILLPCTLALYAIAWLNHRSGDRALARAIMIGTLAGLVAAVAYDIFRLPFVFSRAWGLESVVPQMPLFKVFPRFGAMLLGQPLEQEAYSLPAHLWGWAYHFSNGATFGVMFAAVAGCRLSARAAIFSAVLMAVGIEILMLVSPYTGFFNIHLTTRFVTVTMIAHVIFGLILGIYFAWHLRRIRSTA